MVLDRDRRRRLDFLWLGEPDCHDPRTVGGKAANLSLLAAEFRVPPGFCIPPAIFESVGLDGRAPETGVGERFGAMVQAGYAALSERTGGPDPAVAVRSSGVDEDGLSASLAGLHDTFLNVTGADPVADAALRCLASAFSDRAVAYRRDRGIDAGAPGLAVLVQHLVPADVSAVAFSADPVTGDRSTIVINANWGLGESIASGSVTPDTFTVSKDTVSVTDARLAEKGRMSVPVRGGIKEVDVPRAMRSMPSLNEGRIVEIARLAMALEERMGYPVDVECAFKGDSLYLLQCRPITALGSLG